MDERERLIVLETTLAIHIKECSDNRTWRADVEKRLRNMERYLWMGFGALGILQFIAPYAVKLLTP